MKSKSLRTIAIVSTVTLISAIAIIAVFRFDKFWFAISNGSTKAEVHGEKQIVNSSASSPAKTSSPTAVAVSVQPPIATINKTQGSQSPIVNNSNGTSTINYGTK